MSRSRIRDIAFIPLNLVRTLLLVVAATLLDGCTDTTKAPKGTADTHTGVRQPSDIRAGPSKLRADPIDLLTGEALSPDGRVPPRRNEQTTPSYALLPTPKLWQAILKSRNYALIVVKSPTQTRGFYQNKLLVVARIKTDVLATVKGLAEAGGDGPEFPFRRQ